MFIFSNVLNFKNALHAHPTNTYTHTQPIRQKFTPVQDSQM